MARRSLLSLLALLAFSAGCSRSEYAPDLPGRAADGRPHVIVHCIDTLRADRLGFYGYTRPTSPFLDDLARDSIVFENAIAQAPWTLPSVASYLTSTYPTTHGVFRIGRHLPEHLQTMAETMRAAGYQTVGYVQNAFAGSASGADRGFDVFFDRLSPRDTEDGRPDRHPLGELLQWLDQRESRQPLFLYVHTVEPHWPHHTPRNPGPFGTWTEDQKAELDLLLKRFRKLRRGPPAEPEEGKTRRIAELRAVHAQIAERTELAVDQYDNGVRRADENAKRLVDTLQRGGYWEQAFFLLFSDHGEELGEHGYWQHDQSLHGELIHVPLLLRVPGGSQGRRIEAPVQLIDVLPSIAELIGAPSHPTWEGRSFLTLAELGPASGDGTVGEAHAAPGDERIAIAERVNLGRDDPLLKSSRGDIEVALVSRQWKGILHGELNALRLYDRSRDPGETRDVSGEHAETARELRHEAEEWLASRPIEGAGAIHRRLSNRAVENLRALGYVQ